MRDACNKAMVKANLRTETSKAMGAAKQKNKELMAEEREMRNAKAGLKNAQDQAEE